MKKTFAFICTFLVAFSLSLGQPAAAQEDVLTVVHDEYLEDFQTFSIQSSLNSYDMIRSALLAGEEEGHFDTSELSYLEVGELIRKVTRENPEIMYYERGSIWSDGRIEFTYSMPISVVQANQQLLQSEVDNVLTSIIKPGFTDFDKVKAIHDYIALNTAYDEENFDNDTVPADSYTAFGALVDGIAVCDGYTKAAQILMNRLGIENEYVVGHGNGELHSWNLIKLEGEYYFMDITWDDPTPNRPGYVRYAYFLVTSDRLSSDHQWIKENYPTATSTNYSYYNEFNQTVKVDDTYYYSNSADDSKLYKIAIDGTSKQKINDVRAPYFAIAGDSIYFSNYSYGGYLFKMKKDGSQLEQLNSIHSTDITIEGNVLTYLNNTTMMLETLILDDSAQDPVTPSGVPVESNKMWTITFNKEIDKSSVTNKTVTVKSEDGISVEVDFDFDNTGTKLFVYAPNGGYAIQTNYVLTVEDVKSQTGQVQKVKENKAFHVK